LKNTQTLPAEQITGQQPGSMCILFKIFWVTKRSSKGKKFSMPSISPKSVAYLGKPWYRVAFH
jgi:hypothetical protein